MKYVFRRVKIRCLHNQLFISITCPGVYGRRVTLIICSRVTLIICSRVTPPVGHLMKKLPSSRLHILKF